LHGRNVLANKITNNDTPFYEGVEDCEKNVANYFFYLMPDKYIEQFTLNKAEKNC